MREKIRLGDIAATITKGTTPTTIGFPFVDTGINFVKIESIDEAGNFLPDRFAHITDECNRKLGRSKLEENDILFSIAGAIGRTAIVPKSILPANTNQALAIIRIPSDAINLQFVLYALQSQAVAEQSEKQKQGVAQLNLSLKNIADIQIPFVSSEKQAEIVRILAALDVAIGQRKEQIKFIDQLVKSRFIELFGDPVINPKGFPCYTVGEVIDFQGGSQPDKKYFEYEASPGNIRLIQIRDYKSDKYITYIPKTMAKRFCTADDIMIGRYGPPIFQILKGIEGSFNVALMKATPKMGNREFVRQFLKQDCLLEYLEGLSKRTAGQDGIQMDKLKAYPFPYPPMELQEQFAAFVEQTDKSKLAVQKGLQELEILKKSLMQQYFG